MLNDDWVDCTDGSNYYTVMMRWLGINANRIRIGLKVKKTDRFGFEFNDLRPISKTPITDDNDTSWVDGGWNFHQVGILGGGIYDPVIKVNKTTVYDPETMTYKTDGTVPTNMSQEDYKRAIFDTGNFSWSSQSLITWVE
ncbi:MAG: hypothetical protein OXI63_13000 [Candidatus Poribacteria bacterium]|nr:hypothetical protein [Candidatus Poribacteria bacterium]